MNIIIKTKNVELTESLGSFINTKVSKLEKFFHQSSPECFIEIERETRHHKKGDVFFAQALISVPGKKLVATAHGDDLQKAIIKVCEELEVEIKKYKFKKIELPRREAKKSRNQDF